MKEEALLFRTGYVIELEHNRYLGGMSRGRICSSVLEAAKYFSSIAKAETYVQQYLGYCGMHLYLCQVCFTLIEAESLEGTWQFIRDAEGKAVRFASCQEAAVYQQKHLLRDNSLAELFAFREKEILFAA